MKRYQYRDWLVENENGTVRAVGPNGVALYSDDAGVWIDHEVPSSEFEDTFVLERVAMPTEWFVAALRANGYKVTPPRKPDFGGISIVDPPVPVVKTRQELIQDAGKYLASQDPLLPTKRPRSKTKTRKS